MEEKLGLGESKKDFNKDKTSKLTESFSTAL